MRRYCSLAELGVTNGARGDSVLVPDGATETDLVLDAPRCENRCKHDFTIFSPQMLS